MFERPSKAPVAEHGIDRPRNARAGIFPIAQSDNLCCSTPLIEYCARASHERVIPCHAGLSLPVKRRLRVWHGLLSVLHFPNNIPPHPLDGSIWPHHSKSLQAMIFYSKLCCCCARPRFPRLAALNHRCDERHMESGK